MVRTIKRFCALVLCVVMVWNLFPHQVLAAEVNEDAQKQVKELRFYPDCKSDEYVLVGGKHALEFTPSGNPYRFEIVFVDPDLIGYAFVSSTINHEKAVLDAHYDAEKGLFVTEGYFEPGGKDYIPDNIRVEYTLKTSAPAVGSDVDWGEVTDLLSEDLRNSSVSNVTTGENSTGSVRFSDSVKGLEDVAMDYAIHSVVDSTALGQIRNEYESAEKVLSYVVPGLDDERYYARLDMSDPNTLKMMVDDGLDAGGKAIELTMSFLNESNMEQQALREISESLSDVGTAVGVIGDMYHIHREMDGLRDEVASADYITDKDTALTAIDNLEADQIAFALIVTMIPIIATGGMATGPAAAMFTSIIGVMSAASDTVYKQRIATIMEKPSVSQASWGEYALYGGAPSGFVWELYPEYNTLRFRYNISSAATGILSTSESLQYYDNRDHIKDGVHRIVIEDGAVGLSSKAISEFDALEELELPHSLRTIAYQSIYVCNALEEIDIPEGVTNISSGAFYLCDNLKRISLPVSITELGTIATKCPQLTDVYYAGNADQWEQITGHQLMENQAFTVHLKYPGGTLGNGFSWYFDQQTGTLTITGSGDMPKLPQEDVFSDVIYPWHFFDGKITRVVLSEGITSIPQYAFQNHEEIAEVVLPKSLKSIDWHAFENCTSLTKITLPEGLAYIGDYAFAGSGFTEITVPKSVEFMGESLFSGCGNLQTAAIQALAQELPIAIFENCASLTGFSLADTVTSISANAFSGCTALKNVTIPEQISVISVDAFKDCTALESVTMGARMEEMLDAFQGCASLKDIYYGSSQAAWNAIEGNGTLVEPVVSATKHYTSEGYCGKDIAWDFDEATGILRITGTGDMYDYGPEYYTDAPWHDYLDKITSVELEGSITGIGDYAFYGLKNIAKISIPDTVTSIGLCAFHGVGLEEVKLPKGLTSIGASAFAENKMKDLVIPDSVTLVEYSAFAECENLENVTIGKGLTELSSGMFREDSALKNITIPSTVTIIGASAFQGAGLTNVVIPEGDTFVGYGAFAWCKDLQTVRIEPGVSALGDLAFYMCTGLNQLYFDGDAPEFGENTFEEVNATAYYPGDNNTWTADVRQNYGGKITWMINAPGCSHTVVVTPGKAATCTESGLTEGKHCSVCGEVIVAQQTVSATGHNWKDATCTSAKTCKTCGATSGNALGHSWKAATCSTPKTCSVCGATSGYALGHDWTAGNCYAPKTCKVCGVKDGGVVHAFAHQYDYKCDVCGVERTVDMTRPMMNMYRMYNPNTGEHFYTGSEVERDNLIAVGWQYEGIGFTFPLTTGKPVHRLFQPSTGEHLYTMDENEKAALMAAGWNYEGIAFNSGFENEVPQYRLHNPNAIVGAYHFTASEEEKDNLIAAGWEYQGIGWYSMGA